MALWSEQRWVGAHSQAHTHSSTPQFANGSLLPQSWTCLISDDRVNQHLLFVTAILTTQSHVILQKEMLYWPLGVIHSPGHPPETVTNSGVQDNWISVRPRAPQGIWLTLHLGRKVGEFPKEEKWGLKPLVVHDLSSESTVLVFQCSSHSCLNAHI